MGSATTSVMDDAALKDDYAKKINSARDAMKAFDELPMELQRALRNSNIDLSAADSLEFLRQGWPAEKLVMAIQMQQRPPRA